MTIDTTHDYNLAGAFSEQVRIRPDAIALELEHRAMSYGELGDLSRRVAGWLARDAIMPGYRTGILARRGATAFAGILGACWAGSAWVPLNPENPPDRLRSLLERARLDALIVDEAGSALLHELDAPPLVLGPGLDQLQATPDPPVPRRGGDLAYLMFTSGTTGVPKGVMIDHGAIDHFLSVMQRRYAIGPGDRVSQFFELTFDLSLFDLFMSLGNGATLCVLPDDARLGPARFISERKLSVWFSVPSALVLMDRFRQLQPGAFPGLRLALFCGEALPGDPVTRWLAAAPKAVTENLYGPTEATLACLLQNCSTDDLPLTPERGCVAIGHPYPGMQAAIMDDGGQVAAVGERGELLLAGPQLAAGYWRDPALTEERFVQLEGTRWYRSGDLARQDTEGRFHHLGRIDNQVKIFGHRVELEDIDAHLRAACGCETALAAAWPMMHGSAQGVVAFVAGSQLDATQIREGMKRRVPEYMVPRRVILLDTLPLSANGKFDRKALTETLEQGKT